MTRKLELIGIFVYFFIAAFAVHFFHLNYLASTLISFIPLSLYLTLRRLRLFRKVFLYSLGVSIPVVFIVDYIATVSGSWWEASMFQFKFLGVVPIETVIWAFLYVYFIIYFYEYFMDRRTNLVNFSPKIKYLAAFLIASLALFGAALISGHGALIISYFYTKFAIVFFVLVPLVTLTKHPALIKKVFVQGVYFAVAQLVMEFAAIEGNVWGFPGHYIGMISFAGVRFPVEELLWILLCVPAMICLYEVFADNAK